MALQLALLGTWAVSDGARTRLTIACIALTAAASVLFACLSWVEHCRSLNPSTLLNLYLGATALLDIARLRTAFYALPGQALIWILLSAYVVKLGLLLLEVWEKRRLLLPEYANASPEETSGIYSRMNFWWLNPTFVSGFRKVLSVNDLPPLDDELRAASEATGLRAMWQGADKAKKNALFWVFLRHYKFAILTGVLPRLVYAALSLSQPYLVQRVLDFNDAKDDPNSQATIYSMIGAYAIVYVGLAVR